MRTFVLYVAVAAALCAAPARAQSIHMIGAGVSTCGTWTADRKTPNSVLALSDGQWVLGFLTGVAITNHNADPLRGLDANGVLAWVDNYCQANPIKQIVDAALAFYRAHPN